MDRPAPNPGRRRGRRLATLSWVHWHNTSRLHGYLGDLPPAEFEAIFYATKRIGQTLVEIQ
jgi:putative transposase